MTDHDARVQQELEPDAPEESGLVAELDELLREQHYGGGLEVGAVTMDADLVRGVRDRIAVLEEAINGPLGWKSQYKSDLLEILKLGKRIRTLIAFLRAGVEAHSAGAPSNAIPIWLREASAELGRSDI